MKHSSTHALEFDSFLKHLSQYSNSEVVQRNLLKLKPSREMAKIVASHDLLAVLLQLTQMDLELPEPEIENLFHIFRRSEIIDNHLGVKELLKVQKFLLEVRDIRQKIQKIENGPIPLINHSLSELFSEVEFTTDFLAKLNDSIEAPEIIKNSASFELMTVRNELREVEITLRSKIEHTLQKLSKSDLLQDNFFTVRNDRFVVPVKSELKKRVPGVIHDFSDSEKTAFIEPAHLVDFGNQLIRLKADEKNACRKILKALTIELRENLPQLREMSKIINHYEMQRAVAKWADEFHCTIPRFTQKMNLINSRHPVLEAQLRQQKQKIVSLNFEVIPKKIQTVAITGSNAGGKTVVLKTIGLLTLIAQAGLPVPCDPESEFVCFDHVLADIGDAQSIQHNLSTFSAHLSKVKHFFEILEEPASGPALVLIDEIGSGTDPLEGGAIACSILQNLAKYMTLTVATTHLGTVKTYVAATDRMINAAMLFNTKTFSPEFRLHVGRPGSSHALALVKKMNLPKAVITETESMLNSDQLRLESMLSTLEEDQRQFYRDLEQVKKDKQEASQAKDELKRQRDELKKERKRIMHDAYTEAASMVKSTHKQLQKALKSGTKSNQSEASRQFIHEKSANINKALQATEAQPVAPIKPHELKAGLTVWVEKLQARAVITAYTPGAKKVKIDLDGLPFEVPIKQVGKIIDPTKQPATKRKTVRTSRPVTKDTSCELNILGLRVHTALHQLEKFIDQGMLANYTELRIIHGIGTGVLRAAVQEYLTRLNLDFRDGDREKGEGGSGATIINLS